MFYEAGATYHIYNRSNEMLFYSRENYIYFLKKIRNNILPFADVLAYCLMPNHFHIIATVKAEGVVYKGQMQRLSFSIGNMISGFTKGINRQLNRKGVLFAHKTKAKMLNDAGNDYLLNCFMYVHQNPYLAKLVERIEDWEFSSFQDYIGIRKGTIPNIQLGLEMLQLSQSEIYDLTYTILQDKEDEDFL